MATKSSFKRRIFVSLWILSSFFFVAIAQETDPTEVSALKAIRANLIDPRENLKSWKTGDPCRSKWAGVMCNPEVASDGYLHVRSLIFLNFNLSGQIAPEIGQLSHMDVLDFMWNNISGSIPKEIGKLSSLTLLLLNGNKLSGSLPEELGYLRNLDRFQIDENNISGTLPKSFANMTLVKHFHMNNNSISGQIPSEFYRLSHLVHLLLDNNNLSGYLPPEISQMPNLVILQLDNNNFSGTSIPLSYNNMTKLAKLSLRNCNLEGYMPDISRLVDLNFLDLSHNLLNGSIRADKVSPNITTIDLSNNMLDGPIPSSFTGFRLLQRISLQNNRFTGLVPSFIWQNNSFMANESVILNFENNSLTNISQVIDLPSNVTLMLQGNPLCENISNSKLQFCGSQIKYLDPRHEALNSSAGCKPQSCPSTAFYEYNPSSPIRCFCAAPIRVGYRLKSPGFSHFRPHLDLFVRYLTEDLSLFPHQLYIDSFSWEVGPRLRMQLKFFPESSSSFNVSEILRIKIMFAEWKIRNKDFFGPYELLNFTLLGVYSNVELESSSQLGKGTIIGIAVGAILGAVALVFIVSLTVIKRFNQQYRKLSRWHSALKPWLKIDGVKSFTYKEMVAATDSFSATHLVGQGGYGKVYKGILADGTCVAIKRTEEDSLQGFKEFLTEIEFLSRLHHKNLVSLLGFCCEKDEQMLVYEFMPNGTLRDHLSGRTGQSLSFSTRLQIALGAAKGVKYLHMEANPPVFHRDIKASNILLDAKFTSRVADFGLSRLALEPDNEGSSKGHISTMVKGTPGYLDPEYFLTHKLTDRSDVYSLGVVFLEMLTGMRPIIHGKNIVREAMVASQADMITSIVDKKMGMYPVDSVERFASLALRCCSNQTADRPSISEVVRELENICQLTAESIPDDSETWAPLPPRNDMSISSASSSSTKPIISQSFSPR